MQQFMKYCNIKDADQLLQGSQEEIENRIIAYLQHLEERGLAYNTKNKAFAAIRKFYSKNRRPIDVDYLSDYVGQFDVVTTDRAYTKAEIIALIKAATSTRLKAIILLLFTSGMRIGAIAVHDYKQQPSVMKVGDLLPFKKYGLFAITVYSGTPQQHTTFCTPQASNIVMDYLRARSRKEQVTPDSLLFCNKYDEQMPLTVSTISNEVSSLLVKLKLRSPGKRRHDVQVLHGLRKAWDSTLIHETNVDDTKRKLMYNHKLEGSESSYAKLTPLQLLEGTKDKPGYLSAINALTLAL